MMEIDKLILICASGFVLGGAGAWLISRLFRQVRLLDIPDARSSHRVATPKGGGIGILVSFLLTSLLLGLPATFIFAALLISLVSFYGDIRELSPRFRLMIHFMAAFLLVFPFVQTHPLIPLPFLSAVLLMLFTVGTANDYNFMDGINGIAGIAGVVGFGLLYVFAAHGQLSLSSGQIHLAVLALCIAFSCLGFLPFNLPTARVFMGDVGSILLGFIFAALVMHFSESLLDFICLASFLFPFFADELVTMTVRLGRRENLAQPHRRHFYQLLANEWRIAHWKVSLGYGVIQLMIGLSVLWIKSLGMWSVVLFLSVCFFLFVLLNIKIRRKTLLMSR